MGEIPSIAIHCGATRVITIKRGNMEMDPSTVYSIVLTLHNLATAFWIGGMFALLFAVIPSIKKVLGKSPEMNKLMSEIKHRLSIGVYISFAVLFVTGMLLTRQSGQTGGAFLAFNFSTPYTAMLTVKHILYFVVLVIAVFRSRILDNLKGLDKSKKQKLNGLLLIINLILGIIIIILTAQLTAYAKFV